MDYSDYLGFTQTDLPEKFQKLRKLQTYQSWSQHCFWAGLIGMVVSLKLENTGKLSFRQYQLRTLANGLWGAGFVSWLGLGATIKGELNELNHLVITSPSLTDHQYIKEYDLAKTELAERGSQLFSVGYTWSF